MYRIKVKSKSINRIISLRFTKILNGKSFSGLKEQEQ